MSGGCLTGGEVRGACGGATAPPGGQQSEEAAMRSGTEGTTAAQIGRTV